MSAPTLPLPISVISPSLLVSLAATPCLLAIVAARSVGCGLERVGLIGEEIFRGDRLPVLHLPIDEPVPTDRYRD